MEISSPTKIWCAPTVVDGLSFHLGHCCARWQVESCAGSSGEAVLNQEFVECVCRDAGFVGEHFGGGGGGRDPEHDPAFGLKLGRLLVPTRLSSRCRPGTWKSFVDS